MEEPIHTIYLNPIFDIELKLKTDFNFLLSFFRMFRYGPYLEAPASEVNRDSLDSTMEPSCFINTLKKGATIRQYSETINIRVFYGRDLNSPTKEPYNCSIYAWESIRKVAGIKLIDFSSMKKGEVNKIELPLDITYEELMSKYPSISRPLNITKQSA